MNDIIANIAEICAQKNIAHAVLSPGSRCAPLTLAFVRHPDIKVLSISDERSAAFIGLGISQQARQTVVLVCTSGSAAYNYAPAVAEAFFQQIPLIIFTADRPPEWVDQLDGQTIRQSNIFNNHVKKSYDLPVSYEHPDAVWHMERIVSEAINTAEDYPKGPVHINVPFREPFYPKPGEAYTFNKEVKIINQVEGERRITSSKWIELIQEWNQYSNKLIVAGQQAFDEKLKVALSLVSGHRKIPVVADILTNLHPIPNVIKMHDSFLNIKNEELCRKLQPDLLVTFGLSVISKNIKLLLRKYKPKAHWHIQPAGTAADTFQSLTRIINVDPEYYFTELINNNYSEVKPEQEQYQQIWLAEEKKAAEKLINFFNKAKFGEFEAVYEIVKQLPDLTQLHLANSMAVRYANFVTLASHTRGIEVFANRGTSGIDGSTSTAYGAALLTHKPVVLITGDMAFFYDRNAFWNNYLPENMRVIVLNNHAGGIFRIIEGPSQLPELEEYFETRQNLKAENTAKEFGLDYLYCNDFESLARHLQSFFKMDGKAKILEIETDSKTNKLIFEEYRKKVMSS